LLSTSFSVHSRKKELMPPLELLFVYRLKPGSTGGIRIFSIRKPPAVK